MCILAIKPKGIAAPNEETLREMFERNPDGAGVSYAIDNKLTLIKGLMTFNEFKKVVEKIPVEAVALLHCRITTSGGVCKELTHPFRLCKDIKEMRKTKAIYDSGFIVAHNGIFNEFRAKELNNDTTQFVINYLSNLQDISEQAHKDILVEELEPIINKIVEGSRLAILSADGRVAKYGSGWIEDGGLYYSNSTYKPYKNYYNSKYFDCYNDWWKRYKKNIYNKTLLKAIEKEPELEKTILEYKDLGYMEEEILDWYNKGYI